MSRKIIAALALALSSTAHIALAAPAATASAPEFVASAPDRHVVVRGDTLWGISAKFLKDPFRWSEVWQLNKDQIKDPHWIYPGQVVEFDRINGRLRLAGGGTSGIPTEKVMPQVREGALDEAIPAIPRKAIEPFLTQPLVMDETLRKTSARIVGFEDGVSMGEAGKMTYGVNVPSDAKGGNKWNIVRAGTPLKDPNDGSVLAYEATVIGTARLTKPGDPATFKIISTTQDLALDDRLLVQSAADVVNYPMHTPTAKVAATVLSIAGERIAAGNANVVSLSAGAKNGIERGHVLGLFRPGQKITDRFDGKARDIETPEERFGLVYVFRVFDRVSFGFVMQAARPVAVGDVLHNPQ